MKDGVCGIALASAASGHQRSMYAGPLQQDSRVRIVAVTEEPDAPASLRSAAQRLAADLGVPYREDVDALLGSPEVSGVSLCCPLDRRTDWVRRIAAHGRAIFVDKPMCDGLRECVAIGGILEASGTPLLVGHHSRWRPYVGQMRLHLPGIGEPLAAHAYMVPATGTAAYAGGELLNFALYPVDTLLHLLGGAVESVYCTAGAYFFDNAREAGLEDLACLTLRWASGVCGSVVVGRTPTTFHLNGYAGEVHYRLLGTRGALVQDGNLPAVILSGSQRVESRPTAPDHLPWMMAHFIDCCCGRADPLVTWRDAHAAMAITAAARRSARVDRTVALAEVAAS